MIVLIRFEYEIKQKVQLICNDRTLIKYTYRVCLKWKPGKLLVPLFYFHPLNDKIKYIRCASLLRLLDGISQRIARYGSSLSIVQRVQCGDGRQRTDARFGSVSDDETSLAAASRHASSRIWMRTNRTKSVDPRVYTYLYARDNRETAAIVVPPETSAQCRPGALLIYEYFIDSRV